MTLTFIGLLQLLIGAYLVARGSLNSAFAFYLISSLFNGSASMLLPSLGGASIPPLQFALLVITVRVLMPKGGYGSEAIPAIREHRGLVLFVAYGIAAAIAGPRIFARAIEIAPMRLADTSHLFESTPLRPTSQNITSAIYLLGTLMSAITAHIACHFRGGAQTLVKMGVILAWAHSIIGVVGVLGKGTPINDLYDLFRNATYAQLDASYQGFVRINGISPEASGYATLGLSWFYFNCECWYRSIMPRATGRAALVMGMVLFFSTSSTAYVGLAVYGLFFVLRAAALPGLASGERLREATLALFVALVMTAIAMAIIPRLPSAIWDMVLHMTVDKQVSASGLQRKYWAMQGWHAFFVSGGLGIGPGSFRSSSLITAILGSMGVIGLGSMLYYIWCFLQPSRLSTWGPFSDPGMAVGGAAACSAVLMLIPAAIIAPSPDPGNGFAVFAGAALALRPRLLGKHAPAYKADSEPPQPATNVVGNFGEAAAFQQHWTPGRSAENRDL
jgi:hypothetical protein